MKEIYRRIPKISDSRISCPFCNSKLQRSMQPVYEYWPMGNVGETELPLLRCYNCRVNFINNKMIDDYNYFCFENDYPCEIKTFDFAYRETKESIKEKAVAVDIRKDVDPKKISIAKTEEVINDTFVDFNYLHSDIERKLTLEIYKKYDSPHSTIGIIFYDMPKHPKNELRRAYIVTNKADESTSKKNSYHISHPYSRIIMETLAVKNEMFSYQEQERKLYYYYGNKDFYDLLKAFSKVKKLNDAKYDSLVDICVYHGKGLCNKHPVHMQMVTAKIIGSRNKEPQDLQVFYCPLCNEYYVNYEYYHEFVLKNGIPPLRLYDNRKRVGGGDYFSNLSVESVLATYGYKVSGPMQTNHKARQQLLEDLIDMELIQKSEIVSHIEWLIRFRTDAYNAQVCWKKDLDHIRQYHKNKQRLVFGRFVPGKNKKF